MAVTLLEGPHPGTHDDLEPGVTVACLCHRSSGEYIFTSVPYDARTNWVGVPVYTWKQKPGAVVQEEIPWQR